MITPNRVSRNINTFAVASLALIACAADPASVEDETAESSYPAGVTEADSVGQTESALVNAPASVFYDVRWLTGNNAHDGRILGAINKQLPYPKVDRCWAIVDVFTYSIVKGVVNGTELVDCNADGENAGDVIDTRRPGEPFSYRVCSGYYYGGYWELLDCTEPQVTDVGA